MKKFAWLTDLHLDFLDTDGTGNSIVSELAIPLSNLDVDGFLFTGDISLGGSLVRHLKQLERVLSPRQIYFVCGNHDFYNSSFDKVRNELKTAFSRSKTVKYAVQRDVISLTNKTALIGHDGWYDAYHGEPFRSPYIMSDWVKIHDFFNMSGIRSDGMYGSVPEMGPIISLSRKLSYDAAEHIARNADEAARTHETVIVLTHIPPFPALNMKEGKSSNIFSMPWYTSKLMGDVLLDVANMHQGVRFEVFCGHTHEKNEIQITDNLRCHVGSSEYGKPQISGTIQVL